MGGHEESEITVRTLIIGGLDVTDRIEYLEWYGTIVDELVLNVHLKLLGSGRIHPENWRGGKPINVFLSTSHSGETEIIINAIGEVALEGCVFDGNILMHHIGIGNFAEVVDHETVDA